MLRVFQPLSSAFILREPRERAGILEVECHPWLWLQVFVLWRLLSRRQQTVPSLQIRNDFYRKWGRTVPVRLVTRGSIPKRGKATQYILRHLGHRALCVVPKRDASPPLPVNLPLVCCAADARCFAHITNIVCSQPILFVHKKSKAGAPHDEKRLL